MRLVKLKIHVLGDMVIDLRKKGCNSGLAECRYIEKYLNRYYKRGKKFCYRRLNILLWCLEKKVFEAVWKVKVKYGH